MGGVVRAIGHVVEAPLRAVGHIAEGVGQVFSGDIGGGLKSMFVKPFGDMIKGGLDVGKDLLGDPLITGTLGAVGGAAAGFFLGGGPIGAIAGGIAGAGLGVGLGNMGSSLLGGLSDFTGNLFGLNENGQCQQAHNGSCFGPYNGGCGAGGGGVMPPFMPPYYPMPPQMPPYGCMPPQGYYPPGCCGQPPYGCPQGGQMNPQMQMMMMSQMMGMMGQMMMMMSMMGQMGQNPYAGGNCCPPCPPPQCGCMGPRMMFC